MPVVLSNKIVELAQAEDPANALRSAVGDISKFIVTGDNLLAGTFIRSEKTKGGIIRPKESIQEDVWQGTVGLVLKLGTGFEDDQSLLGQWVMFGYNDGLRFTYNDVHVRILNIDRIRAYGIDPAKVY